MQSQARSHAKPARTAKQEERIKAAREAAGALCALSAQLMEARALVTATTGQTPTINQMLIATYMAQTGCKEFKTFLQWKDAGYKVKKDEKAFRIWGQPIKRGSSEDLPDDAPADTVSDVGKRKYWPTCCLFNEQQVERVSSDAAEPSSVNQVAPVASPSIAADKKKAEKLRALAEKLQTKIDKCFAERQENTPKRRAQAASARIEGQRLERTQTALLALAALAETGAVPAELSGVNSTAAMYDLMASKTEPVQNGWHAFYRETGEPAKKTPDAVAAWALLQPKTEEQKKAELLAEKVGGLLFSQIPGYFPTQPEIVREMIDRADLSDGMCVADTSAGSGHILDELNKQFNLTLHAYEINHTLTEILELKGYTVARGDFLSVGPGRQYDRILMNPPFENLQDIDHVRHAFSFLKPGGKLVGIMSPSPFFRSDKKCAAFREWFESLGGVVEDLPDGSFKASGTNVSTKLVVLIKPLDVGGDDDEGAGPFVRTDYASAQEDRKNRLAERAVSAHSASAALYHSTRELGSVIPMGQPILVGHHSEKRDRAFRKRLDNNFRKAFALSDKADHLAAKAATVGKGGIASDDPGAVVKLRQKLEALTEKQKLMKAANAALRRSDDGALSTLGYSAAQIEKLKEPDYAGRIGFADYELTNNSAEIRRTKNRIEELTELRTQAPYEFTCDDFKVYVSDGRVRVAFEFGKPSKEVRQMMRYSYGFVFSGESCEWTRKATANALAAAPRIVGALQAMESIY